MNLPPLFAARLSSPQYAGSQVSFTTGFPGCSTLTETQRRNRKELFNAADLEKAVFLLMAELLKLSPDQQLFQGDRPAGISSGCALKIVSFAPETDPGFLRAIFVCSFWGKERSQVLTWASGLVRILPLSEFITVSGPLLSAPVQLSGLRFPQNSELLHSADNGDDSALLRQYLEARFCLALPGNCNL